MADAKHDRAALDETVPCTGETWTATGVPASWATVEVPAVDARRYHVVREVGRGGMGRVFEAVDTRLQREVALKQLIRPDMNRARFIREAVLTARLQHPAIVAVHEVGLFADGTPFIAMKLVRGESLRESIRKRASLAERLELIAPVITVCDAVAYAHSQHVIHRDLKPSNVLLGSFGEVVVIDWGLAKHLDAPEAPAELGAAATGDATHAGAVIGTPAYMPPEQARGDDVDARADVYALGGILYELLTGDAPNAVAGDRSAPRTSAPPPLAEVLPDVPGDLAAIVARAMRPDREERYADAAELAADLKRYQLGQMVSAPEPQSLERDPALEAAFGEELRARTTSALRATTLLALLLVAAFAIPPRIQFGRFEARDMVPRACALLSLFAVLVATYRPAGRRHIQALSMLMLFIIGVAGLVANVLQGGVLEAEFVGSMILICLGGTALVPITPTRTLLLLSALTILSMVGSLVYGDSLLSVRFVTLTWLLTSSVVIGVVGAHLAHRVQRAEFYNRYRLQRANERLARLDRNHVSRDRGG